MIINHEGHEVSRRIYYLLSVLSVLCGLLFLGAERPAVLGKISYAYINAD
jgi:hypothetical protein